MPPIFRIVRTIVGSHDHSQDLVCLIMKDFEFLGDGTMEFDHTLHIIN